MKKPKTLFLSGDIDDQKTLQCDWTGAHFSYSFESLCYTR